MWFVPPSRIAPGLRPRPARSHVRRAGRARPWRNGPCSAAFLPSIAGASAADDAGAYTLDLRAAGATGDVQWLVHWGDGSSDTPLTQSTASSVQTTLTHVFAAP